MPIIFITDGKYEINKPYVKSIPGILCIAAVILNAVVFMCSVCSGWCFRGQSFMIWAGFVSGVGFWISLILFSFRVTIGTRERMIQITPKWIMIEAGLVALGAFFYFTVFLDCAINASYAWSCGIGFNNAQVNSGVIGAAAFFAFAAVGVYAADLFFRFQEWRGSGGALPWKNGNANGSTNTPTQEQTIDAMGPV